MSEQKCEYDLRVIGIYSEALNKVHVDCVFNGRGRTEKGRFYLISEETAQAVDDALNYWRKGAGKIVYTGNSQVTNCTKKFT